MVQMRPMAQAGFMSNTRGKPTKQQPKPTPIPKSAMYSRNRTIIKPNTHPSASTTKSPLKRNPNNNALAQFPQFAKFPSEIRHQIWTYAIPNHRLIDTHLLSHLPAHTYKFLFSDHHRIPAILHVNQEARFLTLKELFLVDPPRMRAPFYINGETDTLYFSRSKDDDLDDFFLNEDLDAEQRLLKPVAARVYIGVVFVEQGVWHLSYPSVSAQAETIAPLILHGSIKTITVVNKQLWVQDLIFDRLLQRLRLECEKELEEASEGELQGGYGRMPEFRWTRKILEEGNCADGLPVVVAIGEDAMRD